MLRILLRVVAVVVVLAGVAAIVFYQKVTSLDAERVSGDVHVIYGPSGNIPGLGGNTAVLRTAGGAVIVDTMSLPLQGSRIRELAERVGGGPTQAIINTHYHLDHTHGNPAFAAGSRIVSTDATLAYLRAWDADAWTGGAEATLPNETFARETELRIGGKTIRCLHPGAGHTGGDLVALFVEDRVLAAGDLFFHDRYPFVDLEAGGSAQHWIAALDRVLALDFERVIPGHGVVTDKQGLRAFQRFLRELWSQTARAAAEGTSFEDLLAAAELGDESFEVMSIPFVFRMDREFALRRAWEEATGAVTPRSLPRAP